LVTRLLYQGPMYKVSENAHQGAEGMKYVVDQMLAGMKKELRAQGIDCETATKLVRGTEDSSLKVKDVEIFQLLKREGGRLTLITLDNDLSEYCRAELLPCIRVQDLVVEHIKTRT